MAETNTIAEMDLVEWIFHYRQNLYYKLLEHKKLHAEIHGEDLQ